MPRQPIRITEPGVLFGERCIRLRGGVGDAKVSIILPLRGKSNSSQHIPEPDR